MNAGEPKDTPATTGPSPRSASLWNYKEQHEQDSELVYGTEKHTAIFCRSMYAALWRKGQIYVHLLFE